MMTCFSERPSIWWPTPCSNGLTGRSLWRDVELTGTTIPPWPRGQRTQQTEEAATLLCVELSAKTASRERWGTEKKGVNGKTEDVTKKRVTTPMCGKFAAMQTVGGTQAWTEEVPSNSGPEKDAAI